MRLLYPIEIQDYSGDDPPEVIVRFPDLPEAITAGSDFAEAMANAIDCLEVALAYRIKHRGEIPSASPADGRATVAPGSLIAAKAALYLELRRSGIRPAELARRMGVPRAAVTNRLLNPKHASKPEQFDAAFAALGKRLVVEVETAA